MRISCAAVAAFAGLVAVFTTGCDAVTAPRTGAVRIAVTTSGDDLDVDGYRVRVDNQPGEGIGINTTITVSGVPAGSRVVHLQEVATNCQPSGNSSQSITVVADDTVTAQFTITCALLIGSMRVSVSSSGFDLDSDGYTVSVDDGAAQEIAANGSILVDNIREGIHTVALGGVAANCIVLQLNPFPSRISYATTSDVPFPVLCRWRPGSMRVSVSTSGDSLDADGYIVVARRANGLQRTIRVDATGSVTLDDMEVDGYTVSLANVAGNCLIIGSNTRTTTVATRQTTDVSFAATCTRLGNIRLRSTTTGLDPDPNGYQVAISKVGFGRTDNIASNGTVMVSGLFPGDYDLTLGGATLNCEATSTNPRSARVVGGETVDVAFDLTCAKATQLAYWSSAPGDAELYIVNSNGTTLTRLTANAGDNVEPSWSPDGSKIAFRSDRDGNYEIYVTSASGSGEVQRLTNHIREDYDPAWSPDGAKIAFVSNREGSDDVYVMNADGSNVVRLTSHEAYDAEPAWSPDGSKIAFRSDRAGNPEIYVMNADGSGVTRLTTNDAFDGQPAWSPDGAKIAFAGQVSCDDYYYYSCLNNIFVMNVDGSGVTRLESQFDESQPTWSPDGRWIAFALQYCDYYEGCFYGLWAMKATGTDRTEIVSGAVGNPAWRR